MGHVHQPSCLLNTRTLSEYGTTPQPSAAPVCQGPMNARNYLQICQIIQTYDPGSVYFKISRFEPRFRIFCFTPFPLLY